MTKKHTPGPWWVDEDGCIAAGTGDDYVTIAEVLAPGPWRVFGGLADGYGIASANGKAVVEQKAFNGLENRANALVLAAAPELLAALEDMAQMVEYLAPEKFDNDEHEREFNARLARARDVIQKARGEA